MARYGGNTSCVSVAIPGHDPLLFDLGTGLRYFGMSVAGEAPFRGSCLLSHLHWDHIQGLPFFAPLLQAGAQLDVYAPTQPDGRTLESVFSATLAPPMFPVTIGDFPGRVDFHAVDDSTFTIDGIEVMSRLIPHVGHTCGYRVTWNGLSVAYLSDHQQIGVRQFELGAGARALCEGADLLIHDAQYTLEEFMLRADWGHCSIDYAAWVAVECGVGTLALFHHDPRHHDDDVDRFLLEARAACAGRGVDVVAAAEGLTLRVGAS